MAALPDHLDGDAPIIRALRDSGWRLRAMPQAEPSLEFRQRGRLALLDATRAPGRSHGRVLSSGWAGFRRPRAAAMIAVALALLLAAITASPPAFAEALGQAADGVAGLIRSGAHLLPTHGRMPVGQPSAPVAPATPFAAARTDANVTSIRVAAATATTMATSVAQLIAAPRSDAAVSASPVGAATPSPEANHGGRGRSDHTAAPRAAGTPEASHPNNGANQADHGQGTQHGQSAAPGQRKGSPAVAAPDSHPQARAPGQQRRAEASPVSSPPPAASPGGRAGVEQGGPAVSSNDHGGPSGDHGTAPRGNANGR